MSKKATGDSLNKKFHCIDAREDVFGVIFQILDMITDWVAQRGEEIMESIDRVARFLYQGCIKTMTSVRHSYIS